MTEGVLNARRVQLITLSSPFPQGPQQAPVQLRPRTCAAGLVGSPPGRGRELLSAARAARVSLEEGAGRAPGGASAARTGGGGNGEEPRRTAAVGAAGLGAACGRTASRFGRTLQLARRSGRRLSAETRRQVSEVERCVQGSRTRGVDRGGCSASPALLDRAVISQSRRRSWA